jgi:hypothetical protein
MLLTGTVLSRRFCLLSKVSTNIIFVERLQMSRSGLFFLLLFFGASQVCLWVNLFPKYFNFYTLQARIRHYTGTSSLW